MGIDEPTIVYYVNPPPASFVFLPFIALEPFTAKFVWNCINVFLVFLIWFLAIKSFDIPSHSGYQELLFAFLTCSIPFLRNLQRGQIYLLLLLLVLFLWIGYSKQKPYLAGLALAFLLLLKYFGWMFLLLFVMEKRWKEFFITLAVFFFGTVLSLSFLGVETYSQHFDRLFFSFQTHDAALTGLPCVPALFGSLFVAHSQWNPNPIIDAPIVAIILTISSLVVFLVFSFQKENTFRFFSFLILSVIFTPLAADHHYILLVFPLLVFSGTIEWSSVSTGKLIGIFVLTYLLLGWFPSLQLSSFGGVLKSVLFLRLFAAIVLFFFLTRKNAIAIVTKTRTAQLFFPRINC